MFTAAAFAVFAAAPASAHTSLIDVQPADGATVREGTDVTLTFSDELLELGTEVTVTDTSGDAIPLDVTRPDPASVQVTLPALAGGPVAVAWRVVAGDGHPIEGTLNYAAEGSGATPSDAPSAPAATPPATATTAATASAVPTPEQADPSGSADGGMSPAVWVAIGVAVLAVTAAGVASKRRR